MVLVLSSEALYRFIDHVKVMAPRRSVAVFIYDSCYGRVAARRSNKGDSDWLLDAGRWQSAQGPGCMSDFTRG